MDKKSVLRFFTECLVMAVLGTGLAAGYLGLAYMRDPLLLFHAPEEKPTGLRGGNMRIQAAGVINSLDFDSVIIGTSQLENTSASSTSKSLGGTFMNISLSGSNFWERSIVLDYALKKHSLKRVIYSLDEVYLNCSETPAYPLKNWGYLYNDSSMDDMKAYLVGTYLRDILFGIQKDKLNDLDRPNQWMSHPDHKRRFGGLQNWVASREKRNMKMFFDDMLPKSAAKADPAVPLKRSSSREARAAAYMDKYVFSFAEAHRDTEFCLIFPPYWRFKFADWRQTDPVSFAVHQQAIRHAVKRAAELGNVRIFGFEDCAFVDDVATYMDTVHYTDRINEYMVESIADDRHRLTPENVEPYLVRCEELARKFDIKALHKEAQRLLSEKKN